MHTIVETPLFTRKAKNARVTEDELNTIIQFIANNPDAGEEMQDTGGARKIRFAARGKGKSGGYRVITFYSGQDIPVFLLNIFSKNQKIDLSPEEKKILKGILGEIVEEYRSKNS